MPNMDPWTDWLYELDTFSILFVFVSLMLVSSYVTTMFVYAARFIKHVKSGKFKKNCKKVFDYLMEKKHNYVQ